MTEFLPFTRGHKLKLVLVKRPPKSEEIRKNKPTSVMRRNPLAHGGKTVEWEPNRGLST